MLPMIVGALTIGLPLVLLAAVVLRRQPSAIRGFVVALVLVGTGYLMATGAAGDIGRAVLGLSRDSLQTVRERAQPTTAPAPAPAK